MYYYFYKGVELHLLYNKFLKLKPGKKYLHECSILITFYFINYEHYSIVW